MNASARSIIRRFVYCDLPLGAVRIVFAILSFVLSVVASSLCVKIWTKHHGVQKLLNHNLPPGVSAAVLEYQDVKTTSILVFVFNSLATFTTSHIAMIMVQDIFKIIPPTMLRKMKLPQTTLSSVSLPYQAAALLLSTIGLAVAGAFHTQFVFSRSGTVTVRQGSQELPVATIQATLDRLGIMLPYRDVGYISISAKILWPAIFFALGASIATLLAWYKFRRTPSSVHDSVTESTEGEISSPVGEEEKAKEMLKAQDAQLTELKNGLDELRRNLDNCRASGAELTRRANAIDNQRAQSEKRNEIHLQITIMLLEKQVNTMLLVEEYEVVERTLKAFNDQIYDLRREGLTYQEKQTLQQNGLWDSESATLLQLHNS
ncbi:hypothetical protein MSAN_00167000 [Mycena sanguinolenta]|uniref:Uncharacterized protein n=1 Tax=Mycena sanguinolenta TaxID=230812 RepID=A0A8H6ZEE6_9AGAR|nr:hypothetical protein MSAN_00167000 [Mycena sanguinolenta]